MSSVDKSDTVLVLKYIGEDSWSRPVYQDQFSHLWKDIELGNYVQPSLHRAVNDDFEGEPDYPIKKEFVIQPMERPSQEKRFQYMMLDRLRSDCDYYLGYGNRSPNRLREGDEKAHIEAMKALWLGFAEDEKPEWLSWEKILEYEKQMCGGK